MIEFTCYCHPEPQGSAKGFGFKRANGKIGVAITSANKKLKPFRQAIAMTAISVLPTFPESLLVKHVPVSLEISCYFQKPLSVPKKRELPVVKPDIDKLARAILDALTGILFADDAQVVELKIGKFYGTPERVCVRMHSIEFGATEDHPVPMMAVPLETPF